MSSFPRKIWQSIFVSHDKCNIYVSHCIHLQVDLPKYPALVTAVADTSGFVPVALEESQGNPSRLWVHDGHAHPSVPYLLCLLSHLWLLPGQLLHCFHCFHDFLERNRVFCLTSVISYNTFQQLSVTGSFSTSLQHVHFS